MAFSPSLFALANPTPVSPKEGINLRRNKLTHVGTLSTAKTDRLTPATLHSNNSHTKDRECVDDIRIKHARKLKEAKHIVMTTARENVEEAIHMIDAIQMLGIEYHFEEEIEEALQKQHLIFTSHPSDSGLCEVALQFRLLRQGGYNVPATDVFNKLKDGKGKIKEQFSEDIMGLIELYEASQLSVEGEHSLHEAGDMSHHLLDAWASQHHGHPLSEVITNTLQLPFHKSLPRFSNRSKYSNYFQSQVNKGWTSTLQELAQLDSCVVKSIHQREILQVFRWWNDLGLAKELKSIRSEPLKWHMWPMTCLADPQFSEERIELFKPLSLVYVIDDLFDVCESIDTLTLFTDAVNRWELEATEKLPVHLGFVRQRKEIERKEIEWKEMEKKEVELNFIFYCPLKICFKVLYDITNEFAFKVYIKHGWNPINTLKKLWARLCNGFLIEAQWFASGHLPKAEEYLKNGITTSGVSLVLWHAFFLLDHGITNESALLMDEDPGIMSSVATILRLSDDLEGTMKDNQDGHHDGSFVKCYMKEYQGVTGEDTVKHVTHMISNSWRHLNQECLIPKPFSTTFKKVCLNSARMVPLMYNCGRKGQLSSLEEHIKSLFLC